MKQITDKALKALETLKAMQPFTVIPETPIVRRSNGRTRGGRMAHIATGINSHLLTNLKAAGLIECSHIFLRGCVSADLRIVEGAR